ncbi:uncharacterized protein JN550_000817 [Neoarthrinium moseri]|uniref:uncharacterized protein n=1 Tax=Neoarthrinium moseri TaxID=1658444 RepID=UPI001FDBF6E0|nr:uncharacterized protein JN550_000817 [Neoarthrinium moseri]KAI1876745.1 hypothetical protein JN550_000817 [Neoarthrinium moseri]
MTSINTIVFGPTGHVASAAAQFAQAKGMKVFLAMRDVQKEIPGFTSQQEKEAGFERVYADLTKPETVLAVVRKTKAKRAFLYLIFGAPMNPSIEALKAGGVDFVVFLSSSSVVGDLHSIPQKDFIAWQHARVEIAIREAFDSENYIMVRPGYFNTNTLGWKASIRKGKFELIYSAALFDFISPGDIGRVCGALLVEGPQHLETKAGRNVVKLLGPHAMSQRDAAEIVGKAIGKEFEIVELDDEQGVRFYIEEIGAPEPGAKSLVRDLKARAEGGISATGYVGPIYEEAIGNIQKYTGRQPTNFSTWVEENKAAYVD